MFYLPGGSIPKKHLTALQASKYELVEELTKKEHAANLKNKRGSIVYGCPFCCFTSQMGRKDNAKLHRDGNNEEEEKGKKKKNDMKQTKTKTKNLLGCSFYNEIAILFEKHNIELAPRQSFELVVLSKRPGDVLPRENLFLQMVLEKAEEKGLLNEKAVMNLKRNLE